MHLLKTATELVTFKRGRERIIFNAEYVNPVYFPKGGDEARLLLERMRECGPMSGPPSEICSPELFYFFRDHSLIIPDVKAPLKPVQMCTSCDASSSKSPGKSLYLLLSQSCNQACVYCLNGRETYQKERMVMMSEKVAFKAVKTTLDSISDNGRLEIVFFGGEPLMNWPLAKKVIEHCETNLKPTNLGKKIHYHLTTNLTILPSDLIETAKRHQITFLVNVDGPEDVHDVTRPFLNGKGSFKKTAANIRKVLKADLEVALRATVTKHNQDRMVEVTRLHKELGGNSSAFVPLNAIDSDESAPPYELCPSPKRFAKGLREVFNSGIWPAEKLFPFNEYIGRLRPGFHHNWGCGAPWGNTPTVTAEGKIFSCIYLVGIKKFEVGDIFAGDFPRRDVVDMMLDVTNIENIEMCRGCDLKNLCGGGCPVGQFTIVGNSDIPARIKKYTEDMACITSKTVIEELIWSMAKKKRGEYEGQKGR